MLGGGNLPTGFGLILAIGSIQSVQSIDPIHSI